MISRQLYEFQIDELDPNVLLHRRKPRPIARSFSSQREREREDLDYERNSDFIFKQKSNFLLTILRGDIFK